MSNHAIRRAAIAILTVGIMASVTACGSTSSSSGGPAGASSSPASTGAGTASTGASASNASGAPIVVGSICSCSGPDAPSDGLIGETMQIWEKWVNAHGGVNGHPVKVYVLDDGADAATSLQDAKRLVQQDHVVAIVGEQTAQDITWAKYVEAQGVPVIGGEPYDPPMTSNPDFFPSGGTLPAANYGLAQAAAQQGKKKMALMVCAEAPICSFYVTAFQKMLPGFFGTSVVYSTKIAATSPNYTSQCLAAKQAGADGLFVESFGPAIARVHTDCAQQDYQPAQYGIAATVDLTSTLPSTVMQYNLSIADDKTPAGSSLQQAISQYAPPAFRKQQAYTDNVMQTWAGTQVFMGAAQKANLTPSSTPADLKKGLYALKDFTAGGASAPMTYSPGKPTVISCWFTETRVKTTIPAYSAKPECVPPDRVAQLYEWFTVAG
jgi:branched-chain amino acid transport system substrate-binding protein